MIWLLMTCLVSSRLKLQAHKNPWVMQSHTCLWWIRMSNGEFKIPGSRTRSTILHLMFLAWKLSWLPQMSLGYGYANFNSHAQAGALIPDTLTSVSYPHLKKISWCDVVSFYAVWRIRDVYPGSRILIFTHPGSRISDPRSRISDPGSKNSNKRERWKKICYHTFFVVTILTKLNIMLFL